MHYHMNAEATLTDMMKANISRLASSGTRAMKESDNGFGAEPMSAGSGAGAFLAPPAGLCPGGSGMLDNDCTSRIKNQCNIP